MTRGLEFRIEEEEELFYRGYREADLRFCFRICKSRFFHNEAQV